MIGQSTPIMADPLPGSISALSLSLSASDTHSSLELLVRAQDGDEVARNELCARYLPRLRRWAHGRLPIWAREHLDTEDIVQDTLLRSVRQARRLHAAARAGLLCVRLRSASQSPPRRAAPRRAAAGEHRHPRRRTSQRSVAARGRRRPSDARPIRAGPAAAARARPRIDHRSSRAWPRLPRDCRPAGQAVRRRRASGDQPRAASTSYGDGR